jgi:hypothetical protein
MEEIHWRQELKGTRRNICFPIPQTDGLYTNTWPYVFQLT